MADTSTDNGLHNDADFMAAIDRQMEAMNKSKRSTKKAPESVSPPKEDQEEQQAPQVEQQAEPETPKESEPIAVKQPEPTPDPEPEPAAEDTTTVTVKTPDTEADTAEEEGQDEQPPFTVKPLEDEPEPEPDPEPVPDPVSTESGGDRIEIKRAAEAIPDAVKDQDQQSVQEQPKPKSMNHSGRTLQPISDVAAAARPPSATKPVIEPIKPEVDDDPDPEKGGKPTLVTKNLVDQVGSKDEEPSPELEQAHALKTFDTNKYHLPIKPTHHHRKHAVHPLLVFAMFAALVLFIGLAAIDMELLDIGIELPFDIL